MSSMNNVIEMTIDKAMKHIINYYVGHSKKFGYNFKKATPFILRGQPGAGKSAGAIEMANQIAAKLGKKLHFVDFRLSMKSLVDVGGLPYVDKKTGLAKWSRPEEFALNDSDDVLNFVVLEELPTAAPAVQTVALQMLLDKRVGVHEFPTNTIFIATGNRSEDKGAYNKLGNALCNRLMHVQITADFASWKTWALTNDIDERIVAFLSFNQVNFNNYDPSRDTDAFATPRSWEFASNALKAFEGTGTDLFNIVAPCVGIGIATEFKAYCACYEDLPNIDAIFAGEKQALPQDRPDVIYAVCSGLLSRYFNVARTNKKDLYSPALDNILHFSIDLKKLKMQEYAIMVFQDIVSGHEEARKTMLTSEAFDEWFSEYKKLLAAA